MGQAQDKKKKMVHVIKRWRGQQLLFFFYVFLFVFFFVFLLFLGLGWNRVKVTWPNPHLGIRVEKTLDDLNPKTTRLHENWGTITEGGAPSPKATDWQCETAMAMLP